MPQADVITNGAIIISGFPIFILIHYVYADTNDDSAIEDRLYDFMEMTTDSELSTNLYDSYMQELIAILPVHVTVSLLTNLMILEDRVNSYGFFFNDDNDNISQEDALLLMETNLLDIFVLEDLLYQLEDSSYLLSFFFMLGSPLLLSFFFYVGGS